MELIQRWHVSISTDRMLNGAILVALIGLGCSVATATRGQEFSGPAASVPQFGKAKTVQISVPPTYKELPLLKTDRITSNVLSSKKAAGTNTVAVPSVVSAPQNEVADRELRQTPRKSLKTSSAGLQSTITELIKFLR